MTIRKFRCLDIRARAAASEWCTDIWRRKGFVCLEDVPGRSIRPEHTPQTKINAPKIILHLPRTVSRHLKLETMSDWLSLGTDTRIGELMRYLNELRNQLENMADDYTKRIKAEAAKIEDEEGRQSFCEWSGEDFLLYEETFPRILLNSFHVTVYSLLESEIKLIARRVGREQSQVFDVSEIRGSGYLESAIFYIKKLTGVDVKKFGTWSGLKEGQKLRNIIVHSNGELKKDKDIQLAKKYKVLLSESRIELPSVTSKSIKELSITYDYCMFFLDTLKAFFAELYKQMKVGRFL